MTRFPGRRLFFSAEPNLMPVDVQARMKPGDYWHFAPHKIWLVCAPNGDIGSITTDKWSIVEQEDQTITVHPSIQFYEQGPEKKNSWHGYLVKGEWVEA